MWAIQTNFNPVSLGFVKEHLADDWPVAFAAHELAPEIFEGVKKRADALALQQLKATSPFVKHMSLFSEPADLFFASVLQARMCGVPALPALSQMIQHASAYAASVNELAGRVFTYRRAFSILQEALKRPKQLSFSLSPSVLLFKLYMAKKFGNEAEIKSCAEKIRLLGILKVPNLSSVIDNVGAIKDGRYKFDSVAFLNELSEEKSAPYLGIPSIDLSKILHFDLTLEHIRAHPEEFEGIFVKLLYSPSLRKSVMEKGSGRFTTIVQLFGKQFNQTTTI